MAVPNEIVLRVGGREIIPLTGAGSVGYFWRMAIGGDAAAIEASIGPLHPPPAQPQREPHGGSAAQALFVLGRAAGRATISLALLRAGKERSPRETHEIAVTVRATSIDSSVPTLPGY